MASILVVDDTVDILDILTRQLSYAGHNVICAMNGAEGVACARANLPDLIVMDLVMPMLNGWQAIKQLRDDARCANLPILVITAAALFDPQEQVRAAGGNACLIKPFSMRELFTMVDSLTGVAEEVAS